MASRPAPSSLHRALRARDLGDEPAYVIVALAALARGEIELQRDGRAHGIRSRFDGALGQQRAAEIGVQHRAGEIDHGAHARHIGALQLDERRLGKPLGRRVETGRAGADGLPQRRRRRAHGSRRRCGAKARHRQLPRRRRQHGMHGRRTLAGGGRAVAHACSGSGCSGVAGSASAGRPPP
jgi:hypothetical protein